MKARWVFLIMAMLTVITLGTGRAYALADLEILQIHAPPIAHPGDDLRIEVVMRNIGDVLAPGTLEAGTGGYMVDVVLSSDGSLPDGFSDFSPSFRARALLRGGRVSRTYTLHPGNGINYTAGAGIPVDTPFGRYCLGAVVDPGRVIRESDGANNKSCHWLEIR
jgi:hypothetical protein